MPRIEKTYNQAMNEWQSPKRSFLSKVFLPDPEAATSKRLIGFLWRILLFLVMPWVVYVQFTTWMAGRQSFSTKVGAMVQDGLHAENLYVGPFWVGAGMVDCGVVNIEGTEEAPYHKIEIENVSGNREWSELFDASWDFDRLSVAKMKVWCTPEAKEREIQWFEEGGIAGVGDLSGEGAGLVQNGEGQLRMVTAGLGLKPDPKSVSTKAIAIQSFFAVWGTNTFNEGNLQAERVTVTKSKDGGRWDVEVKKGRLTQNWVRDLEFEELEGYIEEGVLVIEKGQLPKEDFRGGGTFTASISLSGNVHYEAQFQFDELLTENVLSPYYRGFFDGTLKGRLVMEGDLKGSEPTVSRADFEVNNLYVSKMRWFSMFGDMTLNPKFARMPLRDGSFTFETQGGEIRDLKGGFNLGDIGLLVLDMNAKAEEFSGSVKVGLEEFVFKRIPEVKEKYFEKNAQGLFVEEMEAKGILEECLDGACEEMAVDYEKIVAASGKLYEDKAGGSGGASGSGGAAGNSGSDSGAGGVDAGEGAPTVKPDPEPDVKKPKYEL